MPNNFGLFSAATPLCVGEPYDKPKKVRVKGEETVTIRSFVTSPQKKGSLRSSSAGLRTVLICRRHPEPQPPVAWTPLAYLMNPG